MTDSDLIPIWMPNRTDPSQQPNSFQFSESSIQGGPHDGMPVVLIKGEGVPEFGIAGEALPRLMKSLVPIWVRWRREGLL